MRIIVLGAFLFLQTAMAATPGWNGAQVSTDSAVMNSAATTTNIGGTTTANAATAIVGVGTKFTSALEAGDRISLSDSASTYVTVQAIADDTHLTTISALGSSGCSGGCTINRKKHLISAADQSGVIQFLVQDNGNLQIPFVGSSKVLLTDSGYNVVGSSVTPMTLSYLDISSSLTGLLAAKEPTVTKGNLTSGTTGVSVSGGTGAVIGAGASVSVQTASSSQPGLLSSADWSTFNGKQAALTLGNVTSGTTGLSVSGGTGAVVGSGVTLNVQTASGSQPGLLSAANWNTFNGKQASLTLGDLTSGTTGVSVTGGTGAVVGSGAAVAVQTATDSQPGLMSAADHTQQTTNTANIATNTTAISGKQATGNYITALTGEVTATGPGSVAATVAKVGGQAIASLVSGDILYANGSGTMTRLAKGSDTQVLTLASGLPTWATPAGGSGVTGPGSSTTNAIATYADGTGAVLLNTKLLLTASGTSDTLTTAAGVGAAASGGITVSTGTAASGGASGDINITTGATTGSGATGNINLNIGSAGGANGVISLNPNGAGSGFDVNYLQMKSHINGSTSGPAYSFTSATNTGMYNGGGNGLFLVHTGTAILDLQNVSGQADLQLGTTNGVITAGGADGSGGGIGLFGTTLVPFNKLYMGTGGIFAGIGSGATTTYGTTTNDLLTIKDGHWRSLQTTAPTTTVNSNAGTSATCTVTHGTDTAGTVTLVAGSALVSLGDQCDVTFNKAYNVAPICVMWPANSTAASNIAVLGQYVTSTTTTFSINAATAATATLTYAWNYQCTETN